MKIDGPFYAQLGNAADEAKRLASLGYDGVYTLEGSWDPLRSLLEVVFKQSSSIQLLALTNS